MKYTLLHIAVININIMISHPCA